MTHWMDVEIAEAEIAALAADWAAAELRGDAARLDALLADDFACVEARGRLVERAEWIERIEAGRLRWHRFGWTAETIRVFGESAVVVGRHEVEGTHAGWRVDDRCRGTQVWVDGDGGWRLAALHLTPIAE